MAAGRGYLSVCALAVALAAPALPRFDFTTVRGMSSWEATHDVAALQHTDEGMLITIGGQDPFVTGPARDFPEDQPLWLVLRLKSERGGVGQVFYYQQTPLEVKSVRFPVRQGLWEDVRVPLPPLGARYAIRFDPPGAAGTCLLAWIAFEPRDTAASGP